MPTYNGGGGQGGQAGVGGSNGQVGIFWPMMSSEQLLAEIRSLTALVHSLKADIDGLKREHLIVKTGVSSLLERD